MCVTVRARGWCAGGTRQHERSTRTTLHRHRCYHRPPHTAYRCATRVRRRTVFEDRKAQRGRLGSVRWRAWLCWKLPKFLKELEKRSYIRVKETKGVPFIVAILTDNLPQAIQCLQRMCRAQTNQPPLY